MLASKTTTFTRMILCSECAEAIRKCFPLSSPAPQKLKRTTPMSHVWRSSPALQTCSKPTACLSAARGIYIVSHCQTQHLMAPSTSPHELIRDLLQIEKTEKRMVWFVSSSARFTKEYSNDYMREELVAALPVTKISVSRSMGVRFCSKNKSKSCMRVSGSWWERA